MPCSGATIFREKEIGSVHEAFEAGRGTLKPELLDYSWASQLSPLDLRRLAAFVCHAAVTKISVISIP
jgi:hypothetical protein